MLDAWGGKGQADAVASVQKRSIRLVAVNCRHGDVHRVVLQQNHGNKKPHFLNTMRTLTLTCKWERCKQTALEVVSGVGARLTALLPKKKCCLFCGRSPVLVRKCEGQTVDSRRTKTDDLEAFPTLHFACVVLLLYLKSALFPPSGGSLLR
jgi:hypothetical protein